MNEPARPFAFFHLLKRLAIPIWGDDKSNLRAPNVVWILVFCPQLFEVDLGVYIDPADADFLLENSPSLSGISNVKHLSLAIRFIISGSSDKRNWLGSVKEGGKSCNKMTRSIMNLLNLTKGLITLDLIQTPSGTRLAPPHNLKAFASCLSSLHRSFSTLQTLRTIGIGPEGDKSFDTDYSVFKILKYLYVDQASLFWLWFHRNIRLPLSLEVVVLPFYALGLFDSVPLDISVDEENYLAKFLKTRSLPMLREVIVPTQLINMKPRSNEAESPALQKIWRERRAALEKESISTSGKVKLTTAKPGDIGEYRSVCISLRVGIESTHRESLFFHFLITFPSQSKILRMVRSTTCRLLPGFHPNESWKRCSKNSRRRNGST